jgi:hypothetical protein
MRDSEHPAHLDPRKLALKHRSVGDFDGPKQKAVRLNPWFLDQRSPTVIGSSGASGVRTRKPPVGGFDLAWLKERAMGLEPTTLTLGSASHHFHRLWLIAEPALPDDVLAVPLRLVSGGGL